MKLLACAFTLLGMVVLLSHAAPTLEDIPEEEAKSENPEANADFLTFPRGGGGGSPFSNFGSFPSTTFGQRPGGSRIIEIPVQHYNSPSSPSRNTPSNWFNTPTPSTRGSSPSDFFNSPRDKSPFDDDFFTKRRNSFNNPSTRPTTPPAGNYQPETGDTEAAKKKKKQQLNRSNSLQELNSGAKFNPYYSGGKYGKAS